VLTLPVDPKAYTQFLVMMAALAATPGPANVFAIATGLNAGPRAGLIGVLGMNTATLVWFLGAAIGLGALVQAFPQVFQVLALGGGLYIAYLGLSYLRDAFKGQASSFVTKTSPARVAPFRDGFLVQLSNPKALIFFTVVLPPFLDIDRPIVPQLAMFASGVLAFDLVMMSAYTLAGGALAARFSQPRFRAAFSSGVGLLLLLTAGMVVWRAAS
jgi:threonine/homoserine/homoserine lactone efflux protein